MRKLVVAAVAAASLGTLGLSATAQAQPASHNLALTSKAQIIAGIPFSLKVTHKIGSSACTVTVTGLEKTVTHGTAASVNKGCTVEIEGTWTVPGTAKVTIKFKAGTTTVTDVQTLSVLAKPCENDSVGVGSDTITPLMDQISTDWNKTLPSRTSCGNAFTTKPYMDSWDAIDPITGAVGGSIAEKLDCPNIVRPDGSSAGIGQLATFVHDDTPPPPGNELCTNFARSSRPRKPTDPPFAAGGVAFSALAGDAVSWGRPAANTFAPANLSTAQLNAIYSCTDTNWNQVGGGNQAITPFLPQTGSGTLSVWLAAIGVTTPGPCVTEPSTLEENEGVDPAIQGAGVIFPYSIGDYIAQKFHADACTVALCGGVPSNGTACVKTPDKIQFWCDVHGTFTLGSIDGVAPTVGSGTGTTINTAFPGPYTRILFNVVPFDTATADHIPGATSPVGGVDLATQFGATGYDCTNATAKADITNYGFLPISTCGSTS